MKLTKIERDIVYEALMVYEDEFVGAEEALVIRGVVRREFYDRKSVFSPSDSTLEKSIKE